MKELMTMPVKVSNGDTEIEVFEFESGFCMTTEFLGKCIGYGDPRTSMARLFRRHKAALVPHQFVVNIDNKIGRGRPSYFYDAKGCIKAVGLAGTSQAKEFLPRLVDYLDYLEKKRHDGFQLSEDGATGLYFIFAFIEGLLDDCINLLHQEEV